MRERRERIVLDEPSLLAEMYRVHRWRPPRQEYLDGLTGAGFVDAEVQYTHDAAPGMHSAIIRAVKPKAATR